MHILSSTGSVSNKMFLKHGADMPSIYEHYLLVKAPGTSS